MSRVLAPVYISLIDTDRIPIGPVSLLYAIELQRGSCFPPVKLQRAAHGRFILKDGRHRFVAHKLLGYRMISAVYFSKEAK